jgi:NAD(P)H dehydrogenase (quinone)
VITLFGANGKVGRAAACEIRRQGIPVRAVVRDRNKAKNLAEAACEIATAHLRDVKAIKAALDGASSALMICPMTPKARDPLTEPYLTIDAIGQAIEEVKPRCIVAISDYGAHHATGTGVALIFHRLEQRLGSTGVVTTFLRSCEQMQNWARFVSLVTKDGVLPIFHQPRTRLLPLVSGPDVGLVAAELLIRPSHEKDRLNIIHVEGPQRYSPNDLVDAFQRVAGRPVIGRESPHGDWVPSLVAGGLSESYAQLVAGMYGAHNAGRIEVEILLQLFDRLSLARQRVTAPPLAHCDQ